MQPVPISLYVHFGTQIRYLQDAAVGGNVHGQGWILENIELLLSSIRSMALPVTSVAPATARLSNLQLKLANTQAGYALTAFDAGELSSAATALRDTLLAELSGRYVFATTDKQFELAKLLWAVESLLAPTTFGRLSAVAQYDVREAGTCVAFERSTAAAFHVLRATEDCIRAVYFERVPVGQRMRTPMWGGMVERLRKTASLPEALLNHLNHIRKNFRNPTDHPDKIYSIYEAQNLFSLCLDAIDQLVAQLGPPPIPTTGVPPLGGPTA